MSKQEQALYRAVEKMTLDMRDGQHTKDNLRDVMAAFDDCEPPLRPMETRYVMMTEDKVDHDRIVQGRPVPRVGDEVDTGAKVYTVTNVQWRLGLGPEDNDIGGVPMAWVFGSLTGTWQNGRLLSNTGRCRAGEESP